MVFLASAAGLHVRKRESFVTFQSILSIALLTAVRSATLLSELDYTRELERARLSWSRVKPQLFVLADRPPERLRFPLGFGKTTRNVPKETQISRD